MGKKRSPKWATTVKPKPPVILSYADTAEAESKLESCCQQIREVILLLPREVQARVGGGVELHFKVDPPSSVLARYFPKGAALILLKEELFENRRVEIAFNIAHEVAHFILNHRYVDPNDERLKLIQELEAEELAITWLKKEFSEETLRKFLKSPRDKKQ